MARAWEHHGNGMARSHQTTARNQTTSVFVVAFAASVLLWPTLIAASWLYMPAPIAAMNSAVHLVGMIATAGPSVAYLCSSVARARKRRVPLSFTRRPDSGGSSIFPSRVEACVNSDLTIVPSPDSGSIPLNSDHLDLPTFWRRIDRGPAAGFEDATRHLGVAVDRILRKHGKNIIGKQFASKRLADIMIDLFVLAAVLSRVSTAISETSAEACATELQILRAFSGQALERVKGNFAHIDLNDDDLIKALADDALAVNGYRWDNL